MPFVVASLVGWIAQALASVAVRVLVGLGLGYISYKGVDTLLAAVQGYITSYLGSLTGQLALGLSIMNIPQGIAVLFSYYAVRVATQASSKLTFGKKAV